MTADGGGASDCGAPPREEALSWLGHPRGLSVLFLTETWNTFSFYGMRASLVYYMTGELRISQAHASLIYGAYAAAVFCTPIFGAIAADRLLGKRNAVILGASLMALGHFMMAWEELLFPALGTIALGNGFFVPSLTSQIKSLYDSNDRRLTSAYSVYYFGINLGGFIAPLVCGTVGEAYGWHWGFAIAGFGMLAALCIYLLGMHHLPIEGRGSASLIHRPHLPGGMRALRRHFAMLIGIMAIVAILRGAYEQQGNTIALWAREGVDRSVAAHWSVPMTWFQSMNPLLVFVLTPVFVFLWGRAAKRGYEPTSLQKMSVGAAVIACSYWLLALLEAHADTAHGRVAWPWLILFFLVLVCGELLILPVGLGFFGRFAPKGYEATAIATWFFAGFAGNLLAGGLGTLWSRVPAAQFFVLMGIVAGVASLLLTSFIPMSARIERCATHPPSVSEP